MKVYRYLILALLCALSVSCSKDNTLDNEEPQTVLSDIAGTWFQYAYLCSDGYFVDISDTGDCAYYEFAYPNIFTQYTVNESGEKEIIKQGEWVYNAETKITHITEPKGWNVDIAFDFGVLNDSYIATMKIKGRTQNSSSTIKARLLR